MSGGILFPPHYGSRAMLQFPWLISRKFRTAIGKAPGFGSPHCSQKILSQLARTIGNWPGQISTTGSNRVLEQFPLKQAKIIILLH